MVVCLVTSINPAILRNLQRHTRHPDLPNEPELVLIVIERRAEVRRILWSQLAVSFSGAFNRIFLLIGEIERRDS